MKTDKHGKRIPVHYCGCGMRVHGNGAWASHKKKHKRRNDGQRPVTFDVWQAKDRAYRYGTHCLNPDTCNPSKSSSEGCVCSCDGCKSMRTRGAS